MRDAWSRSPGALLLPTVLCSAAATLAWCAVCAAGEAGAAEEPYGVPDSCSSSLLQHGSRTVSRTRALQHGRETVSAPAPEEQLQGYYLTLASNQDKQRRIGSLLAADWADKTVLPFIAVDSPLDSHRARVHKAHMVALLKCKRTRPHSPCLIMEDDAVWPSGGLTHLVTSIVHEQGRDWDLMMLGMGNALQLRRKAMLDRLKPSHKKALSMRIQGTLGGCHAYIVNGRPALMKLYRLFEQRQYQLQVDSKACVEGLNSTHMTEFGLRVVSPRFPFVQQAKPNGGPDVYKWRI